MVDSLVRMFSASSPVRVRSLRVTRADLSEWRVVEVLQWSKWWMVREVKVAQAVGSRLFWRNGGLALSSPLPKPIIAHHPLTFNHQRQGCPQRLLQTRLHDLRLNCYTPLSGSLEPRSFTTPSEMFSRRALSLAARSTRTLARPQPRIPRAPFSVAQCQRAEVQPDGGRVLPTDKTLGEIDDVEMVLSTGSWI